mgnify:FL=1
MARSSRTSQASQARAARQIKRLYEMCAMAIVAGRADLDGAAEVGFDIELPVFSVGAAASSPTCIRRRCASMIALAWSYRNVRKVARGAIRCATSPVLRKRSNSARKRASTWLESRASSNLRKRTASCTAKWSGCASRPVPACSPRTRTVASWKSSGPSARACGAGSCEPMHGSFRRANPYGRNVRKRGTIWAPGQW